MGVIYKLIPEIVQYILDRKKANPNLSCRELVDGIAIQFHIEVCKSSVNEILREANISTPRGRKVGSKKFKIPDSKKSQLLANLPSLNHGVPPAIFLPPVPAPIKPQEIKPIFVDAPQLLVPLEVKKNTPSKVLKPLEKDKVKDNSGEIFLQAAFSDVFPKPWGDIKTYEDLAKMDFAAFQKEWDYRSLSVESFQLDLEDGSQIHMDARCQSFASRAQDLPQSPLPLEHALIEMADLLLNNIQPIVIKEFKEDSLTAVFYDFLGAFEGKTGKNILKIDVLSKNGQSMSSFGGILPQRRNFILGVEAEVVEIKELVEELTPPSPLFSAKGGSAFGGEKKGDLSLLNSYFYSTPLSFMATDFVQGPFKCRAFVLKHDDQSLVVLSNLPESVPDEDIVRTYAERFPIRRVGPCVRPHTTESHPTDGEMPTIILDYLKNYAATQFFGTPLTHEDWTSILQLKGWSEWTDQYLITNLIIPDSYDKETELLRAIHTVNSLGLHDQYNRPIWVKPATEKEQGF